MRADIYQAMARAEDTHWWFKARRGIIAHILRDQPLPASAVILDAGSGTGGNLAMLSEFGQVCAMEMDAPARVLANNRGIVTVEEGMLPGTIPFDDKRFDLIVLFDVLEHIEEDFSALSALHTRLNPEGRLMLTVPAFEMLWSLHDDMHHHKRRYSLPPLVRLLERAGYKVTFASYINFWLFPVIASLRIIDRLTGGRLVGRKGADGNAELTIPPSFANRLLEAVFASESRLLRIMRLPFGVSIVLTAKKV
jgi:SAM-dependent methyltransferase